MSKHIDFQERAWSDYLYWQTQDKKMVKRINALIKDIERGGHDGMGRPEPLVGDLSGWWSRRIDDVNRMVYRVRGEVVEIAQCRGHYEKKT
jgi:toxin YoeB